MGEQLILRYSKLYGISSTSLRFFNVYVQELELQEHMALFLGYF